LQFHQFGDGIIPSLRSAATVGRLAVAQFRRTVGMTRPIDLMSVSGPGNPGREARPGLCPGPAKGAALGTSLSAFIASD
jgi:hypothetical protein